VSPQTVVFTRGRRGPPRVLVLCPVGLPPLAVRRGVADAGAELRLVSALPSSSDRTPGDAWRTLNAAAVLAVATPATEPEWVREVVAHAGALPVIVATPARDPAWERAVRRTGVAEVVADDDARAIGEVLRHLTRRPDGGPSAPRVQALSWALPLAGLCTLLGLVALARWWDGQPTAAAGSGLQAMKANTALMFLLLGTAVMLAARRVLAGVGQLLCAGVALIAAATLVEYLVGRSLGLDTQLAADPQVHHPGRPSLHSAAAFLLGAGAAWAYGPGSRRLRRRAAGALLFAFAMVVLLAVVGYLYGVEVLRGASPVTGMAPSTAAALALLALAIPALAPDKPPFSWLLARGEAGILFRRLLPAAIIIPPLLGGLWLPLLGATDNDVVLGTALFAVSMVVVFTALVVWVVDLIDETGVRRERADTALRESEVRFRQLGTLAPVGMQEFDAAGNCTSVNPRWTEIAGIAPRAAWGIGWLQAVHPEDRDRVAAGLRTVLTQGQELRQDHRLLRRDGTLVWVSTRIALVTDADGRRCGALGTIVDITPQKQAQAAAVAREELLSGLLDHWPGAVIVHAAGDGRIVMLNRVAATAIGTEVDAVLGRSFYDLLPRDAAEAERARDAGLTSTGAPLAYEETVRGRTYDVTKFRLPAAPGETPLLAAIGVDITERIRSEEARRKAQEDFRHAFEHAPIGIALVATDASFLKVNAAICGLLGHPEGELVHTSLTALAHPEDVEGLAADIASLVAGTQESISSELRLIAGLAEPIWVALGASVVRDDSGAPLHLLVQLLDVTERRHHEQQLQDLADRDPLTGLLNRRSFARDLERQVQEVARYGPGGALLILDIDHFKLVNDTLGHTVGDELIVAVAGLLRQSLREVDIVARLGGDEFAVLLPKAGRAEAEAVAEKLVGVIREEAMVSDGVRERRVTASLGITFFDGRPRTGEEMLIDADLAMYDAKEGGRDRWAHFASERFAEPRMKARVTWVERLRRAMEEDRLSLYAQPILDLGTDRISQYELLLRLIDEHGDAIPPGVFLYVAERYDLIQEIDRWVAGQAIGLLAAHPGLVLEVNVSGKSLDDSGLLELVENGLRRTGVDPRRLIFEITETAAIANIHLARGFAERLRALGCRFALDDFGAGFGSFYYLKHLPFDFLKIDGEFISGCRTSRIDQLVIDAVVGIARGVGKETIAEFVTDPETRRFLRRQGVDHAQGFDIGRPAPVAEVFAEPRPGDRWT
jgi:diguanylate cyclase (GGDEF)-like protein/PAS domain S-box-containing protein